MRDVHIRDKIIKDCILLGSSLTVGMFSSRIVSCLHPYGSTISKKCRHQIMLTKCRIFCIIAQPLMFCTFVRISHNFSLLAEFFFTSLAENSWRELAALWSGTAPVPESELPENKNPASRLGCPRNYLKPVLGIRGILMQIRIRVSISLTNGSGFRS
jgi:hypothetical protein